MFRMNNMRKSRGGFTTFGATEWRNPEEAKKMDALMANPLFNINKIKATGEPAFNKQKIKNFAQGFVGSVVKAGPNGKPQFQMPNKNTATRNLGKFSSMMGFVPQQAPVQKNWYGNPYVPNQKSYPIEYGKSAWRFGVGGKKTKAASRKNKRRTMKTRR